MILESRQGVIKEASRVFIGRQDIMLLFECSKSTAYNIVRKVNTYAEKNGELAPPAGKTNKYTVAKLYNIPIEDINQIIRNYEK